MLKKVQRIRNYLLKRNLYLDIAKIDNFWQKNAHFSRTQGVCHVT